MKFGYARISTPKQSLESQLTLLKKSGCERIFSDVISGYNSEKKEFEKLMHQLRPGDTVSVTGIDRLGRSTRDLSTLLEKFHEMKVDLIVIGYDFDTRTAQGRMIFNFMAMIAENERMRNMERIQQGLEAARAQGKHVGRPPKLTAYQIKRLNEFYYNKSLSVKEICFMYNISKVTLYKYLNRKHSEKSDVSSTERPA